MEKQVTAPRHQHWRAFVATPISPDPMWSKNGSWIWQRGLSLRPVNRSSQLRSRGKIKGIEPRPPPAKIEFLGTPRPTDSLRRRRFSIRMLSSLVVLRDPYSFVPEASRIATRRLSPTWGSRGSEADTSLLETSPD